MTNKLLFTLLFGISLMGYAQQKNITGTITGADGTPIPGVNVVVKGASQRGTQTDFDGVYTISAAPQEILVFTFVGFQSEERLLGANTSILNITLEESTESLDEVVVVGYGVQRKRDVTGAISQVKGDEIADLVTPSFESQLSGRAAGVQITTQNGIVGEAPRFRIRGIALKKALVNKKAPPFLCDKNKEGGGFLIIHLERKIFLRGFFLTCKNPIFVL